MHESSVIGPGGPGRFGLPNVMFYSHDTYGLGHLRRTLALAHFFRSRRSLSQLIVTGSPLAHRFALPPDADYLKLPSVVKVAAGTYESRSLDLPFRTIRALRRDVLLGAARHFRPSILVVDNVPAGLKGELLPTLRFLKSSSCRLVLGLRDVIDEADRVRSAWTSDGSYDLLDEIYDRILVYGIREIYDPVAEYAFPQRAAEKTRFVGYLGREPGAQTPERIRSDLGVGADSRFLLVMAGGGEDAYGLLCACLEAIRLRPHGSSFECLLVGGPFLPPRGQQHVRELSEARGVRYIDFVEDLTGHVQAADAVVSMGGYNSVCELLSLDKPALIIPRTAPRKEQLIRARELSRRGCLRMLHPAEVDPQRLFAEMTALLDEQPTSVRLPMDGLGGTAGEIDELLADAGPEPQLAFSGARVV